MELKKAFKRADFPNVIPRALSLFFGAILVLQVAVVAAPAQPKMEITDHVEGELLVGFQPGTGAPGRAAIHRRQGSRVLKHFEEIGVDLIRLPVGLAVAEAASRYKLQRGVAYASPNYYRRPAGVTPNDPEFPNQWGLRNIGQSVDGDPGSADADIDASESGSIQDAWQVNTGTTKPIVAVIDTGVDITHPDLSANIWTNPGEIAGNSIDDDGNGYVDDRNGWDFANHDSSVYDPSENCPGGKNDDHGTHVAGIIGAVGNNGVGTAGVNWRVQIMPLKFISKKAGGCVGEDADAIEALIYAARMGVKIGNISWGGPTSNPALRQAFIAAGREGMGFAVAAGNAGKDLSITPDYPPAWNLENMTVVAASDNDDNLASFSDFGGGTDLAAPGQKIRSTITGGAYAFFNGTSMAAPMVSGAMALLQAQYKEASSIELIDRIHDNVDQKSSFAEPKTSTGGRLNVNKAMRDPRPVIPTVEFPNGGEVLNAGSTTSISWTTNIAPGNPAVPYRVEYTPDATASTSLHSGFESGIPAGFSEPADSDGPWSTTPLTAHSGSFSAQSGMVANGQASWLITKRRLSSSGTVSFWYRTSSEDCETAREPVCGDYLRFYVDGVPRLEVNGEVPWTSASFPVGPGEHEFSWAYQKDQLCPGAESPCVGNPPVQDKAWIDDVSITGVDAVNWQAVGTASSGTTSFDWTIPNVQTIAAKVRVCEDAGTACSPESSDESDGKFRIKVPTPEVIVNQSGGSTNVTEGGSSDSYAVALATQPSSNVTISIDSGSQLAASPSSAVFTSSNWSTPQTVNVLAVNDQVDEPSPHFGTITHSASSSDPTYNGISVPSLSVSITDNDTAAVLLTESGGSTQVREGGSGDSYNVVLATQPVANVTISISSGGQISTGATSLVFTGSNWSTPQTVNVSAIDDSAAEGPHQATIIHSASSADSNYGGISISSVTVSIQDNDHAVIVTQSGGSTNAIEGGSGDSYSVVLTTQPSADVTISVNSGSQVNASPTSLLFTSANWSSPQTVSASAVDDSVAEGSHTGTLSHSASSSDPAYNGISVPPVVVGITDNDTSGVAVSESGGETSVTEGGSADSYSLALTTQPTANVTISINSGSQLSVSTTSRTFTPSNWSNPQTVNVSAVDDSAIEGSHSGTVQHSANSSDPSYNGISIRSIVTGITDNDFRAAPPPQGYWIFESNGGVHSRGAAGFFGSASGSVASSVVDGDPTPTNNGYWIAEANGGIHARGAAGFFGSAFGVVPSGVVGIAAHPNNCGYWILEANGGVHARGCASFIGSAFGVVPSGAVAIAATPDGGGYWIFEANGGIHARGNAGFFGSAFGVVPSGVVGADSNLSGGGYWIVEGNGGVHSRGTAGFFGSAFGVVPSGVMGMSGTHNDLGYWIAETNGGIHARGNAQFLGSAFGSVASSVVDVEGTDS